MRGKGSSYRLLLFLIALTTVGALAVGVLWYQSHPAAIAANRPTGSDRNSLTLDPNAFEGRARQSYEIARKKPSLLVQLHCYCGCDKVLGHRNLLDCYRDKHAAKCATCMGEAIDSDQMNDQGSPVEQIRDALRVRYEFAE
jgi:hypothetical protein